MVTCDVLVVGGGPAGSACAWRLARSGLDVVVVDSAAFPRDKVCAGWITPQVIADLDLDLDDYRRGRTLQPITGFRTGLIGCDSEIETVYVMASPQVSFVSSSGVKEIAAFGGKVDELVPEAVARRLRERFPDGRPGAPENPRE